MIPNPRIWISMKMKLNHLSNHHRVEVLLLHRNESKPEEERKKIREQITRIPTWPRWCREVTSWYPTLLPIRTFDVYPMSASRNAGHMYLHKLHSLAIISCWMKPNPFSNPCDDCPMWHCPHAVNSYIILYFVLEKQRKPFLPCKIPVLSTSRGLRRSPCRCDSSLLGSTLSDSENSLRFA